MILAFTPHRRADIPVSRHRNVYAVTVTRENVRDVMTYLREIRKFPRVEFRQALHEPDTISVMGYNGLTTSHPLPAQMTRAGEFVIADPA